MHVHILGIGNVGKLIAHSLSKSLSRPRITLLFHRVSLLSEWTARNEAIEVVTRGVSEFSTGYDVECISKSGSALGCSGKESTITNLIVSTKTTKTVEAIQQIRHRLTRDSTIMLAQNGMGIIEELNSTVFPDAVNRPQYTSAVVMHGIYTKHTFGSIHAGTNSMTAGKSWESSIGTRSSQDSTPLLKALADAPSLGTIIVPPSELLAQQFEKIVINGSMSALSSVLDCKYGDLFHSASEADNSRNWKVAQRVIEEMSRVVLAILNSQVGKSDGDLYKSRFSVNALEAVVKRTAQAVGDSFSSMLEDVRAGRETEIDYINGYIVRRGTELGLECRMNKTLVELVKGSMNPSTLYRMLSRS